MEFGTKVKVLRAVRGLTQGELATRARVSKAYIAMMETGKAVPADGYAARLHEALGWTPELEEAFAILEGDGAATPACTA